MTMSCVAEAKAPSAAAPAAPAEPAAVVFDQAALLERLMNDQEMARLIVSTFLQDVPEQLKVLRSCLAAGDAPGVQLRAHTIKGASANLGAEALRAVALEMEMAAKAGNLAGAPAQLAKLEIQFVRLQQAIPKELSA